MPNGRTSLFYVLKDDFRRLLGDFPDDAEIGKDLRKEVTTLEVKRRLDEHPEDRVTVDEQDHSWYIVQFMKPSTGHPPEHRGFFRRLLRCRVQPGKSYKSNDFNWVTVGEPSPLHACLRQYQTEWLKHRQPGEVVLLQGRLLQYDGKEWRAKKL